MVARDYKHRHRYVAVPRFIKAQVPGAAPRAKWQAGMHASVRGPPIQQLLLFSNCATCTALPPHGQCGKHPCCHAARSTTRGSMPRSPPCSSSSTPRALGVWGHPPSGHPQAPPGAPPPQTRAHLDGVGIHPPRAARLVQHAPEDHQRAQADALVARGQDEGRHRAQAARIKHHRAGLGGAVAAPDELACGAHQAKRRLRWLHPLVPLLWGVSHTLCAYLCQARTSLLHTRTHRGVPSAGLPHTCVYVVCMCVYARPVPASLVGMCCCATSSTCMSESMSAAAFAEHGVVQSACSSAASCTPASPCEDLHAGLSFSDMCVANAWGRMRVPVGCQMPVRVPAGGACVVGSKEPAHHLPAPKSCRHRVCLPRPPTPHAAHQSPRTQPAVGSRQLPPP